MFYMYIVLAVLQGEMLTSSVGTELMVTTGTLQTVACSTSAP